MALALGGLTSKVVILMDLEMSIRTIFSLGICCTGSLITSKGEENSLTAPISTKVKMYKNSEISENCKIRQKITIYNNKYNSN